MLSSLGAALWALPERGKTSTCSCSAHALLDSSPQRVSNYFTHDFPCGITHYLSGNSTCQRRPKLNCLTKKVECWFHGLSVPTTEDRDRRGATHTKRDKGNNAKTYNEDETQHKPVPLNYLYWCPSTPTCFCLPTVKVLAKQGFHAIGVVHYRIHYPLDLPRSFAFVDFLLRPQTNSIRDNVVINTVLYQQFSQRRRTQVIDVVRLDSDANKLSIGYFYSFSALLQPKDVVPTSGRTYVGLSKGVHGTVPEEGIRYRVRFPQLNIQPRQRRTPEVRLGSCRNSALMKTYSLKSGHLTRSKRHIQAYGLERVTGDIDFAKWFVGVAEG